MQYTIVQQLRREQPMKPEERLIPMTSGSHFYEWRYHMKKSLLLLTTRLKYKDYENQWIYSKPKKCPKG